MQKPHSTKSLPNPSRHCDLAPEKKTKTNLVGSIKFASNLALKKEEMKLYLANRNQRLQNIKFDTKCAPKPEDYVQER